MKRVLLLIAAILFGIVCLSQDAGNTLPAGVAFPAQLITKLNSHKSKVGDEVKLEVTANLHGPGGAVVLPKGAKLLGTVTEVKDRSADDGQSELSFVITKAEWHGGGSMLLHAVPTAVTAPRVREQRDSRNGGGESAGLESGGGGGGRRGGGGSGGGGGDTSTTSLLAAAIAMDIKGLEVRETGDAKIGTAFFSHRDVSLPSGAVITLRQVKPAEQ